MLEAFVINNFVEAPRQRVMDLHKSLNCYLFRLAILFDKVDVFDYLLALPDFPLDELSEDGGTALVIALRHGSLNSMDNVIYFVEELLKKGASVNFVGRKGSTPLHAAVRNTDDGMKQLIQLLLEKGADVNARTDLGETPLHMWSYRRDSTSFEILHMLLCYGADPSVGDINLPTPFECALGSCYREPTLFDYALGSNMDLTAIINLQRAMFYHGFDNYSSPCRLSGQLLLTLAQNESPLFYEILKCPLEIYIDNHRNLQFYGQYIFTMKSEYLRILIEKCNFLIREVLAYADFRRFFCGYISRHASIENFNLLLESNLRYPTIDCIANIRDSLISRLIKEGMSEATLNEFVIYLLTFGLSLTDVDQQEIYVNYGYNLLFKIALHTDIRPSKKVRGLKQIMPSLICNVNLNLKECLRKACDYSWNFDQLFDYFANYELKKYCYKNGLDKCLPKIRDLPEVPSLLQLARDVFLQFFVEKLNITTTKQFYSLVNALPIGESNRKVITFEAKLY